MKKAILGKKIGMTQLFRADGTMIPVTVVEAGPCPVVQKKTVAKEGYDSASCARSWPTSPSRAIAPRPV